MSYAMLEGWFQKIPAHKPKGISVSEGMIGKEPLRSRNSMLHTLAPGYIMLLRDSFRRDHHDKCASVIHRYAPVCIAQSKYALKTF
jgi:hypothetical protein